MVKEPEIGDIWVRHIDMAKFIVISEPIVEQYVPGPEIALPPNVERKPTEVKFWIFVNQKTEKEEKYNEFQIRAGQLHFLENQYKTLKKFIKQ